MFSSFLSTDKNRGETSIIHAWNTKSRGKAFLPRFATSLSLSLSRPFPPSASSRVSVRLKGWLTDWRDELLQGILERIVSLTSRVHGSFNGISALGFTLVRVIPSSPSLLRQLRRVLVYPCSTPLAQPPCTLYCYREVQGIETETDISFSVPCFRSHSEIRPLIRRAQRNMHILAFGARCIRAFFRLLGPWDRNCFCFFFFLTSIVVTYLSISKVWRVCRLLVILFQSSLSIVLEYFYLSSFQSRNDRCNPWLQEESRYVRIIDFISPFFSILFFLIWKNVQRRGRT